MSTKKTIKFKQGHYVKKGKHFKAVELLKEINHIDTAKLTKNEKELIKVLKATLVEFSAQRTTFNVIKKTLSQIHHTWEI